VARAIRERLWRVRKDHTWIDAQIQDDADGGVEIAFSYDGERIFARLFPTRTLAIGDAAQKLRDLQRAGWTTHW
jgi:hypothetical protein